MNIDRLRESAMPLALPSTEGVWHPIHFSPEPATGERINIGVIFHAKYSRRVVIRLIDSLAGYSALYGSDGVQNFQFLLALLKEQVAKQGTFLSPSPQIFLGEGRHASGHTPDEIADDLYRTVVSLSRARKQEAVSAAKKTNTISTEAARQGVVRFLRTQMKESAANQIIREEPIIVRDEVGRAHALDLSIWGGEDLFHQFRYGAVVSLQYTSPEYRGYFLNTGTVHAQLAYEFAAKGKPGAFFVLRPNQGQVGTSILHDVDNEIDNAYWWFGKHRFMFEVSETQDDLHTRVLEYLS